MTTTLPKFSRRSKIDAWPIARLGDVCEINPRRPSIAKPDDSPTTFVPMPAIDQVAGEIAWPLARPFGEVKRGYTYFADGDVLFAKITPCMQNGKHAIVRKTLDGFGMGSTEFHVLRPGTQIISEWIHFFLRQPTILDEAAEHFSGSVGQQRVPEDFIASLPIPLPPLSEQKRIAALLTDQLAAVDRARLFAEQQLSAAAGLAASELRGIFSGHIPLSVDSSKTSAPPGFEWTTLSKIARLESGHTPSRRHPEWWGGNIPWLALPDIRQLDAKIAMETKECTNELGLENSSARLLPTGTVCLSRTASVGFVTMMGRPMSTSQDFVNWVCGPQLLPEYLMLVLLASREYIRSLSAGAIHKTVYVPAVKQFKILLPSIPRQKEIVASATSRTARADALVPKLQQQSRFLDALPSSLLRSAFGDH